MPADLGGLTLTAGVYKSSSSLGLTGTLTLDAQGNPDAVFIFQAGSTLITASWSHVKLINGARPCNVFWQVGSSATLGTTSVFTGNILTRTSISVNNSVTIAGRALARSGAVTLNNDTITAAHCSTAGSFRSSKGGRGRSPSTDWTISADGSAPPNPMAAYAWPIGPSPGWPGESTPACR